MELTIKISRRREKGTGEIKVDGKRTETETSRYLAIQGKGPGKLSLESTIKILRRRETGTGEIKGGKGGNRHRQVDIQI